MDDIKKLEQEKRELNALINKGVEFDVEDFELQEVKRFLFIKKRVPVKIKRHFKVEQPTLGTLDRLSAEWIEFDIDEAQLKSDNAMQHVMTMTYKHTRRCAKIIALAVLNSDYLIPKNVNGAVRYAEDKKRLDELTDLFLRTIKPSKLYELYILIRTMSNLGDFLNSIRLMSADRTTMPIRIEENKEG